MGFVDVPEKGFLLTTLQLGRFLYSKASRIHLPLRRPLLLRHPQQVDFSPRSAAVRSECLRFLLRRLLSMQACLRNLAPQTAYCPVTIPPEFVVTSH